MTQTPGSRPGPKSFGSKTASRLQVAGRRRAIATREASKAPTVAIMLSGFKTCLAGVLALFALLAAAPAAQADHRHYYGMSAEAVAKHLGCRNFTGHGAGEFNLGSGVCWLSGRRVNIITFRGPAQQGEWNGGATVAFGPRFYWAVGRGANIVAKNGNLDAARVGARALPGQVRHG